MAGRQRQPYLVIGYLLLVGAASSRENDSNNY
jgi:hypothetical protein